MSLDEFKVLVFDTQEEAQACLNHINQVGASLLAQQGYDLTPEGKVIGKSQGNNQSQSNKTVTETWDDITQHPQNGKFFFRSPSRKYPELFQQLVGSYKFIEAALTQELLDAFGTPEQS